MAGGALTALPYPDGFFDQVVTFGELELLPEAEATRALAELKRVLRQSALIVLHTKPDAEDRWPDQADLARAWRQILSRVTSYADCEPALLGRVEELIDFVTADTADRT